MAIQKKHGKGRLDKYYWLAKEKGYRARASFKLIQLNKKYHFLEKSKVLIDLCAAPGSWCQVAAESMPVGSQIIGVDLSPIKPIPRCFTFQSDITTDKCRATIRQQLQGWKADTVLHDGAPNVGTAWVHDAFSQAELVLQSMKLATEFLNEGGTFVTKVFRSKDSTKLEYIFRQLFKKVEHTKPPSSRTVSAEIFYVCQGYLAPKKIDPRFLDPKTVFAELLDPTPNNEAKVFNPEIKKRKRDGYEEGNYTQYKEAPASEFIQTTDPIAMLGQLNKLSFEQTGNGDIALATLARLPETTEEIKNCCADLKVLGKKDFRSLLRWRINVRVIFGFAKKATSQKVDVGEGEVAEVEEMDEELKIEKELEAMQGREDAKKRRERRKENEVKRKEAIRMQLGMTTPMELGMEQDGPMGDDAVFALKQIDGSAALRKLQNGKMHVIEEPVPMQEPESSEDEDEDGDRLETQMDRMYEQYKERRAVSDAKFRAKMARTEHGDGEWEGFSASEDEEPAAGIVSDDSSDDDEGDAAAKAPTKLIKGFNPTGIAKDGLTHRASSFFDQDIFAGLDAGEDADSGIDVDSPDEVATKPSKSDKTSKSSIKSSNSKSFELAKSSAPTETWDEDGPNLEPMKNGRPDIDIITAEAMSLAHAIATGEKTKADLIDDGFNKYTLRDVDGLPDWFLDDENQHSKPLRPITKAAADAIKERLRALNARPIKKVREAKDRKKYKAAQRLEKMRKKSAVLLEDENVTEADKAKEMQKMMAKAARKKPQRKVTVVVARGHNRGISGRPKGTKGRYKMVDARSKKDMRALKRLKKKMA